MRLNIACVYGNQESPVTEQAGYSPTNPYARSKVQAEQILQDICKRENISLGILRYFNPVGCHPSGIVGEDPKGEPMNLMPYVAQVASGGLKCVQIYGDDWQTKDGTGCRDYLHVCDLAQGHILVMDKMHTQPDGTCLIYNMGTGTSTSVREMIDMMRHVSGAVIPTSVAPRRPGDVAEMYADVSKAARELGWRARRSLREMCVDLWRWHQRSPKRADSKILTCINYS